MQLFAHVGITMGGAYALEQACKLPLGRNKDAPLIKLPAFDYRFILLGSMLPDLIDKPLGLFILPYLENLRTFAHTLLFLIVISLTAVLAQRKWNKDWGFFLALGVLVHFLLDAIWQDPVTLFWPFISVPFNRYAGMDLESWTGMRFHDLLSAPQVFIPEAIGFAILVIVGIKLIIGKGIRAFFWQGSL